MQIHQATEIYDSGRKDVKKKDIKGVYETTTPILKKLRHFTQCNEIKNLLF